MLSQDSLENYVKDAQRERVEEQRRLQRKEIERKQFASKVLKGNHTLADANPSIKNGLKGHFVLNNGKK